VKIECPYCENTYNRHVESHSLSEFSEAKRIPVHPCDEEWHMWIEDDTLYFHFKQRPVRDKDGEESQ